MPNTMSTGELIWILICLAALVIRLWNFKETLKNYTFSVQEVAAHTPGVLRRYAEAARILALDDIRREVNRLIIIIAYLIVGIAAARTPSQVNGQPTITSLVAAWTLSISAIIITLDGIIDAYVRNKLNEAVDVDAKGTYHAMDSLGHFARVVATWLTWRHWR